ncbi:TSL-kinase interacting protein 1-like [Bidens hawaiensis]|uniref:TSL-kinase interacting protein 1-like n=1 Tax=Bidens hawaiensis TaxID=980011 RepID=UPI0040497CDB
MRAAMKPYTQRKENIAPPPGRNVVAASKVKKGPNTQKRPARKAPVVLSVNATEVVNQHLSVTEGCIGTKQEVDPLTKIKLQLFPIDEVTRSGLEMDGLNPFLELTLKARKKISSVINHIHTKWSGSRIAIGEPMLVPYDAHLRQSQSAVCTRWTSKDSNITAGDVYTAVQSPAVFRLRYGWFSRHEPQTVSAATDMHNCINSEGIHKPIGTSEDRKCVDATAQLAVTASPDTDVKTGQSHELLRSTDDNLTNLTMGGLFSLEGNISNNDLKSCHLSTDISIGGLLSEASLQRKLNNQAPISAPIPWDDNLTALSIGGLLSEASLKAKLDNNNNNTTTNNNNDAFISDSLDAMVSSHVKTNGSSILDAEETCHAFAFKKFASSAKNVRVTARSTQDSISNPFRFPHNQEQQVEKQVESSCGGQQFGEDSRSLGLRGITWNESLGPFDLGNSMPWKVFGGGNV